MLVTRGLGGNGLATRGMGSFIPIIIQGVKREVLRLASEINKILRLKS